MSGVWVSLVSQSRFWYLILSKLLVSVGSFINTVYCVSTLYQSWCFVMKIPLKELMVLLNQDEYIYSAENSDKFKNLKNKIIHSPAVPDITF